MSFFSDRPIFRMDLQTSRLGRVGGLLEWDVKFGFPVSVSAGFLRSDLGKGGSAEILDDPLPNF